jgi:hypothetical protein
MLNIFDCSSIENYLWEILNYALNEAEVAIVDYTDGICLATISIAGKECQIQIACPAETDIQFGYKIAQIAIGELHSQGLSDLISSNFHHLKTIHSVLIKKHPLIYKGQIVNLLLPSKNYRMAILYGLVREVVKLQEIELIPINLSRDYRKNNC